MPLYSTSRPAIRARVLPQLPATVRGSGGITIVKLNGVWTVKPQFSDLGVVLGSAVADPTSKQVWIYDPVTQTYNVLTLAGLGDSLYRATSTTSLLIGTGSKTFVTQSGKNFGVGSFVLATSDADPTNFMLGQVTSYAGTSLVITVTAIGGSGTRADWTLPRRRRAAPSASIPAGRIAGTPTRRRAIRLRQGQGQQRGLRRDHGAVLFGDRRRRQCAGRRDRVLEQRAVDGQGPAQALRSSHAHQLHDVRCRGHRGQRRL